MGFCIASSAAGSTLLGPGPQSSLSDGEIGGSSFLTRGRVSRGVHEHKLRKDWNQ